MKVVNFRLDSVEAKRFVSPENMPKEMRIDNNSTVLNIKAIDDGNVEITFRYTAIYGGVGVITIEGTLVLECNAKDVEKEWRTKRRMPQEVAQIVHSTVLNNCIAESFILARDVKLPPPIPPPMAIMGQQQKKGKDKPLTGYV